MSDDFEVTGTNDTALFSLKLHRGEGMLLLAMNWKSGTPPDDFAGFAIEYQEPGGGQFFKLNNRLSFTPGTGSVHPSQQNPTTLCPIQKFRWVHFPRNAELPGLFTYRVTPVFMDSADQLSYGEPQQASLELRRETYPGALNVAFTRGFVSSQAFVDRYGAAAVATLIPAAAKDGLRFVASNPKAGEALAWMGFEALSAIHEVLDQAIADPGAQVRVIAYDLNEPGIVSRLEQLQGPAQGDHRRQRRPSPVHLGRVPGRGTAAEGVGRGGQRAAPAHAGPPAQQDHRGRRAGRLSRWCAARPTSAGAGSTCRTTTRWCSTAPARSPCSPAPSTTSGRSHRTRSVTPLPRVWQPLGISGVDAQVAFSPHAPANALLSAVAADLGSATSSLFYSLAFLYQTEGPIRDAITRSPRTTRFSSTASLTGG